MLYAQLIGSLHVSTSVVRGYNFMVSIKKILFNESALSGIKILSGLTSQSEFCKLVIRQQGPERIGLQDMYTFLKNSRNVFHLSLQCLQQCAGEGDEFECRFSICFHMVLQELLDEGRTFRWTFRVSLSKGTCLSELSGGSAVLDQTSRGLCSRSPTSGASESWRVFVEIISVS